MTMKDIAQQSSQPMPTNITIKSESQQSSVKEAPENLGDYISNVSRAPVRSLIDAKADACEVNDDEGHSNRI